MSGINDMGFIILLVCSPFIFHLHRMILLSFAAVVLKN